MLRRTRRGQPDPESAAVFHDLVAPLVGEHGGTLGMPHFKRLSPSEFSEIHWLHAVTKRWLRFARNDKHICEQRYRDYRSADYDPPRRMKTHG